MDEKETVSVSKVSRCSTGIPGFDIILQGGLPRNRLYVVEGEPGSGKTTVALEFLLEGARLGEKSLYITFSETEEELRAVADSHHWDLSKIQLIDLLALEKELSPEAQTTLFHPSEMELNQITENILNRIRSIQPSRIVFDSISEMRLLAESPLRYRKQILALKQILSRLSTTVLFLDDLTNAGHDLQVQSIAHGVFHLSRLAHEFGGERRQIKIVKLRGVNFISGFHDFDVVTGGAKVFPRMISSQHVELPHVTGHLSSGVTQLDNLLGGGLDWGTANLIIGPAGTGKSSISVLYALSAIAQGSKVAFFCFDETIPNLIKRSQGIGMDVINAIQGGSLFLQKIDPAELSPGAFAGKIQNLVVTEDVKIVVIDSLNGYIQAMPQEQFLTLQLHELLAYLNNRGMVTIMTLAQHGLIGSMRSPIDLTYLADTVILTRYFESSGSVRKAISVTKKRTGKHEPTIREFSTNQAGLHVGPPLAEFEGVLTGVPRYRGGDRIEIKG